MLPVFTDLDMESYLYQKARNEAFSRWLTYAANHKVEEETSMKAKQVRDYRFVYDNHKRTVKL